MSCHTSASDSSFAVSSRNSRSVSRTATFFLCLAMLGLSLSTTEAARMRADASSSSSSVASVNYGVYSVWDANDACSEPERSGNCLIDVTCSTCVQRPGCAIESTTGKCVSEKRINGTRAGVSYFPSETTEYCLPKDAACDACRAPDADSNAVCRGFNNCVCLHECEAAPRRVVECTKSESHFNMFYLVIAGAFLVPAMVMARVYKFLKVNMPSGVSRTINREQRAAAHGSNPMTMKLEGWRSHMEKEQHDKLDHKLCPVRMSTEELAAAALEEGRKTEDCDTLSFSGSESQRTHSLASLTEEESKEDHRGLPYSWSDHEYVSITTPKATAAAPTARM